MKSSISINLKNGDKNCNYQQYSNEAQCSMLTITLMQNQIAQNTALNLLLKNPARWLHHPNAGKWFSFKSKFVKIITSISNLVSLLKIGSHDVSIWLNILKTDDKWLNHIGPEANDHSSRNCKVKSLLILSKDIIFPKTSLKFLKSFQRFKKFSWSILPNHFHQFFRFFDISLLWVN